MFYAHSHVGPALVANHAKILRRFNHFSELNSALPSPCIPAGCTGTIGRACLPFKSQYVLLGPKVKTVLYGPVHSTVVQITQWGKISAKTELAGSVGYLIFQKGHVIGLQACILPSTSNPNCEFQDLSR